MTRIGRWRFERGPGYVMVMRFTGGKRSPLNRTVILHRGVWPFWQGNRAWAHDVAFVNKRVLVHAGRVAPWERFAEVRLRVFGGEFAIDVRAR